MADDVRPQDGNNNEPADNLGEGNPPDGSQPGSGQDGNIIDKDTADKWKAQRQEANRQAKVAKEAEKKAQERAEAAEAELKKYREAEMTEIDKAKSAAEEAAKRAEEAEKKAAAAEARAHRTELESFVAISGVKKGKCTSFVTNDLLEALKADSDLDREKWIAEYKKTSPEFFNGDRTKAPGSAQGGSDSQPTTPQAKAIKEVEDAIAAEKDPDMKFYLKRRLRQLQRGA